MLRNVISTVTISYIQGLFEGLKGTNNCFNIRKAF